MARVNHKRVKQLLNEHRSKITDRQFLPPGSLLVILKILPLPKPSVIITIAEFMSRSIGARRISTVPAPMTRISKSMQDTRLSQRFAAEITAMRSFRVYSHMSWVMYSILIFWQNKRT